MAAIFRIGCSIFRLVLGYDVKSVYTFLELKKLEISKLIWLHYTLM